MSPDPRRSLFWLLDHHPDTGETPAAVYRTALAQARLADALGYRGLWLAEHHFDTLGTAPNPAVVLAAIAQCTRRLRIGPAVAVLPLRHPVNVAEDYALVDVLSGGRLQLGVGTGSRPGEFAALGVDFDGRRSTFDAHLAELRRRWRAAAAGERGAGALNVAPHQCPLPPIYVASMHVDGARRVGEGGDSLLTLVSPATADVDEVAERVAAHARGLAAAGHAPHAAEAVVAVFACAADSASAAEAVAAPALGSFLRALLGAAPPDPLALYRQMQERGTGLFGTPQQIETQIERYAAAGVRHLALISRFGGMPAAAAAWSLRALAPVR